MRFHVPMSPGCRAQYRPPDHRTTPDIRHCSEVESMGQTVHLRCPMNLTPTTPVDDDNTEPGPYIELSRHAWADLAGNTEIDIDDETLERIRGLGDPTDQTDVAEVYRPLTQLIHLYCMHTGSLFEASNTYLQLQDHQMRRTPFVIGVAGSVAVGKSTTARLLQELLGRSPRRPKVDLVPTDGFLYPNAVLEEHGILDRKGFPESYDRKALLKFVVDVKSGAPEVVAPVYSHVEYDIVAGQQRCRTPRGSRPVPRPLVPRTSRPRRISAGPCGHRTPGSPCGPGCRVPRARHWDTGNRQWAPSPPWDASVSAPVIPGVDGLSWIFRPPPTLPPR